MKRSELSEEDMAAVSGLNKDFRNGWGGKISQAIRRFACVFWVHFYRLYTSNSLLLVICGSILS